MKLGWFLLFGMFGCAANLDPLGDLLGNPATMPFGQMNLPLSASVASVGLSAPYRSGTPYFRLTGMGYQTQVFAPIDGLVVQNMGTTLKILYNARVSVVLGGFLSSAVAGVRVFRGAAVGTVSSMSSQQVTFEVDVDGVPVCPLGFLNSQALSQLYSYTFSGGGNSYCN